MSNLLDLYDGIKNDSGPKPSNLMNVKDNGSFATSPGAQIWRNKAVQQSENLQEDCAKKFLLNVYCNILPLDTDYVQGNQGMMKGDIDGFLKNKGMSAMQYLTSCGTTTNAPVLEFVIRSMKNIGRTFMEESQETLKDAQKKGVDLPPPEADANSKEVEDQLVEIEKDDEVKGFLAKLKAQTVEKIVKDVSDLIKGKQEEEAMTFNPKTESTIEITMDYFHHKLWKESVDPSEEQNDLVIAMAIRESTLNMFDVVFEQSESNPQTFANRIRFGKGIVMNESGIEIIKGSFITENYNK